MYAFNFILNYGNTICFNYSIIVNVKIDDAIHHLSQFE